MRFAQAEPAASVLIFGTLAMPLHIWCGSNTVWRLNLIVLRTEAEDAQVFTQLAQVELAMCCFLYSVHPICTADVARTLYVDTN